ncbi:MAG: hypothetical protein K2O24_06590, partial [Muribaculaceae bacterium]|nr:hypothetical protein [Muribaculaceae bacterium]
MKNISIAIEKCDVFLEVELTASYAGARGGAPDDFGRVAATAADRRLLDRFWRESCARLTTVLRPVLHGIQVSDTQLSMTLLLSDSTSEALCESIETDCRTFLGASLSSRWFETVRREEAAPAAAFADATLD